MPAPLILLGGRVVLGLFAVKTAGDVIAHYGAQSTLANNRAAKTERNIKLITLGTAAVVAIAAGAELARRT